MTHDVPDNTQKNPDDWTTGREPMTGAQKSYLHTLSEEAGQPVTDDLTKAEASQQIDALRDQKHVVDKRSSGSSNTEKDPADWATGSEPMTGAQKSYLKTLSAEAGVEMDDSLDKADASKRIEALRSKNPRAAAGDN